MIQTFDRFFVDHLSVESNLFFPNNPVIDRRSESRSPTPAPVTQLMGIDAKTVVTCLHCKTTREKENMTHVLDMVYPKRVGRYAIFYPLLFSFVNRAKTAGSHLPKSLGSPSSAKCRTKQRAVFAITSAISLRGVRYRLGIYPQFWQFTLLYILKIISMSGEMYEESHFYNR